MNPPVDRRSERAQAKKRNRRKAILTAAKRVFAEKGYHRAHVSDIIAAAGIARGTFYLYFESKNAIFQELLDELLGELRGAVVGVDTEEGAPPVQTQLITTVHRILNLVAENRALTKIVIREAVGLDDEVDGRLRSFYDELLRYIRDSLENGRKMGFIRDLDTEVASLCVLGTIKQVLEQLALTEEEHLSEDVSGLAMKVLDYNLRGLLRT